MDRSDLIVAKKNSVLMVVHKNDAFKIGDQVASTLVTNHQLEINSTIIYKNVVIKDPVPNKPKKIPNPVGTTHETNSQRNVSSHIDSLVEDNVDSNALQFEDNVDINYATKLHINGNIELLLYTYKIYHTMYVHQKDKNDSS